MQIHCPQCEATVDSDEPSGQCPHCGSEVSTRDPELQDQEELKSLLVPYPADEMTMDPVGGIVNQPAERGPGVHRTDRNQSVATRG